MILCEELLIIMCSKSIHGMKYSIVKVHNCQLLYLTRIVYSVVIVSLQYCLYVPPDYLTTLARKSTRTAPSRFGRHPLMSSLVRAERVLQTTGYIYTPPDSSLETLQCSASVFCVIKSQQAHPPASSVKSTVILPDQREFEGPNYSTGISARTNTWNANLQMSPTFFVFMVDNKNCKLSKNVFVYFTDFCQVIGSILTWKKSLRGLFGNLEGQKLSSLQ